MIGKPANALVGRAGAFAAAISTTEIFAVRTQATTVAGLSLAPPHSSVLEMLYKIDEAYVVLFGLKLRAINPAMMGLDF